jgi:hypothetical protein
MIMLSEEELEMIHWRATRGSHYAGTYIQGSKYAQHVVEEDVPLLLMEIHILQQQIDASGVGELISAVQEFLKGREELMNLNPPILIASPAINKIESALKKITVGDSSNPPDVGN